MINLYFVLGVAPQCSMAELKSAYRRCARETHPDHRGDAQRFQRIQEAYDILGDPQKRALYDQALYAWMQKLCGAQGPSGDPAQGSSRPPQEAQRREIFVAEAQRQPWPIARLKMMAALHGRRTSSPSGWPHTSRAHPRKRSRSSV